MTAGHMAGGRVRFLVAGVQKGGTSALFDYLREVPALELPAIKEAHFFDDEVRVDWERPNYAPYHALFRDERRLWGEATPIYIYWPQALERIRRYDPAMRIILLLRDPVERAWSHWKMEYARRKETEPFAWCIRAGRARVARGDPRAPGHDRVHSYVERGFYGRQFARLIGLFPRHRILLLRSDDLDRAPDATIARVCAFLGVDLPGRPLVPRRVREAAAIDYPSRLTAADVALLRELYAADLALLAGLAGTEVSRWIGDWGLRESPEAAQDAPLRA